MFFFYFNKQVLLWVVGGGSGHPRLSKGGQGEVGTLAISDRGCVSLGLLTMKASPGTLHNDSPISVQ